jgi:hypothetical protein
MDASVDEFAIDAAFDADELSPFAAADVCALVLEELSALAEVFAAAIDAALAFVFEVEDASREASALLATWAAMLASGLAAEEACVVASAIAAA